jgi:mannose-6-phosphate isomerase-like protein (cupin superfamily)
VIFVRRHVDDFPGLHAYIYISDPGDTFAFHQVLYFVGVRVPVNIMLGAGRHYGDAPHGFRNISNEPVVWQDMLSPQPKPADANPPDTFFVSPGEVPATAERADLRDPRTRFLGHFDDTHLPPAGKMQMEGDTGGNIHGIRLKMLVDHQLGSQHMTLFMVEFTPGGEGVLHDHPFEETYYILSGQAEARLDGKVYPVGPGDFVWTGVGGTHGFFQVGTEPVRWIETQAPQPPAQQGFRFTGEWQYLNEKLHSHGHDHDHDHGHGHSH